MDNFDKTYLDIDELAKKIEERIKELEAQEKENEKKEVKEEYSDKSIERDIADLDEIIRQIDARIAEFELEEAKERELNIEDLTNKINKKLEKFDDIVEEDLGKTIYDLSEISNAINDAIKSLETKKKQKNVSWPNNSFAVDVLREFKKNIMNLIEIKVKIIM